MLEKGTVVGGKYTILKPVGKGGMSQVYLAINEKANKKWVIKELKDKNSLSTETEVLMQLSHPGLPSIVDIIEEEDRCLIVMDYVEGKTLSKLVSQKEKLSEDEVINIAIQICDVLGFLHSSNPPVIYRDLKLSNVILRPDGQVVLIDFGTARWFKEEMEEDTVYLGTRGYAAPEQYGGMGQTDGRTDIYAFGRTLQQLIKGVRVDSSINLIIEKCTNHDPKQRYENMGQIKFDLSHLHIIGRDMRQKKRKAYRQQMYLMQGAMWLLLMVIGLFFFRYFRVKDFLGVFYFENILPLFEIIYSLVIDLKSINF